MQHSDRLWPYSQTLDFWERLSRDKHSSLLRTFMNYGGKKFCNIGPMLQNFFCQIHFELNKVE